MRPNLLCFKAQNMNLFIFIFIFIMFTSLSLSAADQPSPRKPAKIDSFPWSKPQEAIEVTTPLPTEDLPPPPRKCTLSILRHSFTRSTMGGPPISVPYSRPSGCPPPWSHAVLHLHGTVSGGNHHDGIASIWLGGVEILRTSTPEASSSGTFWDVRKDITRYSSLLKQPNIVLSMMIENHFNNLFNGVYDVNLSILFYKEETVSVKVKEGCWQSKLGSGTIAGVGGYEKPSDMVIPVAADQGNANGGLWLRIKDESRVGSKRVVIPMNAYRLVLEMYASSHGDDEFWYSNPPNRYLVANNLTTNRGSSSFREIYVKVDGVYVGSDVPFPVVFPGGVNPLFWKPVVAIGAFNMPTYDFDLTPFIGSLSDGRPHKFELGVAHAIQYWLIGANLHVWMETELPKVEAQLRYFQPPQFIESTEYNFKELDGLFEINARRTSIASGWVATTCGNLTTTIARKVRFKNSIMYESNGAYKVVTQHVKVKTNIREISDMGMVISRRMFKRKYPLSLIILTLPGPENDTNLLRTNITVALKEKSSNGRFFGTVRNRLQSGGWMVVKNQDQAVISGRAETQQTLSYRGSSGCFLRNIGVSCGRIQNDHSSSVCPNIFRNLINLLLFNDW